MVTLPDTARRISGKTFHIITQEPSGAWYQTLTFTFDGGSTYQSVSEWPGYPPVVIDGGLNNVFRYTPIELTSTLPSRNILIALRGYWQDDHTFVEEYISDMNTEIALMTQKDVFEGNHVSLELTSALLPFPFTAEGEMEP
jgi:hypothetical protein